ncbi:putative toxin-antitoxin system toxin component, PIN family [Phenylobacterium sp.]|uniref:PIN domain-containing protein n=1 Tax=Phenylobacterium sp. TaxID=1871053 RepID=UPI00273241BF|nr:PIN domain-containing protein [Phenylobacterium sp.]MDP3856117.1 PIN domain-containing protein [Phenylobacterium sp.]
MTGHSVVRICLDLNVWCAAYLADRAGRQGTASQTLVEAARSGQAGREPLQLVVSWGMLERLKLVLVGQLQFDLSEASALVDAIAGYAHIGPSLTLGRVGVIPIHDIEDRHVLETAWAGRADVLVTANLQDFVQDDDEIVLEGRTYRLTRGGGTMILAHPFEAAGWLRDGTWRITGDATGA